MGHIETSEVAELLGKLRPDATMDSNGFDDSASVCQWCGATKDGTAWHFADLEHAEGCALVAFCGRHGLELPGLPAFDPDVVR